MLVARHRIGEGYARRQPPTTPQRLPLRGVRLLPSPPWPNKWASRIAARLKELAEVTRAPLVPLSAHTRA